MKTRNANNVEMFGQNIPNKKISAFTLVELIIVITILAILATIGFISFQSYTMDARDSKRKADLGEIRNGLEVYQAKKATLPMPDNYAILSSGATLGFQGYAGVSVLSSLRAGDSFQDSTDKRYYTYSLDTNKTKYQLLAMLELNTTSYNNLINNTYAIDYTNRYVYTLGTGFGVYLSGTTKTPIQEGNSGTILSITGSNITVVTNNSIVNSPIIGTLGTVTRNIGGTNYSYSTKVMPDGKTWITQPLRHPVNSCNTAIWANTSTSFWCGIYSGDSDNGITYGWLYQWSAAIGNGSLRGFSNSKETTTSVCTALGQEWRLPSDTEWQTLEQSMGCSASNTSTTGRTRCGYYTSNIRGTLDAVSGLGWASTGTNKKMGGLFSVLSGTRSTDSTFNWRTSNSTYWSSTESSTTNAIDRGFSSSFSVVNLSSDSKAYGHSIVCLKD